MLRSVVLPEPDRPVTTASSPEANRHETPASATTSRPSSAYRLWTESQTISMGRPPSPRGGAGRTARPGLPTAELDDVLRDRTDLRVREGPLPRDHRGAGAAVADRVL